MADKQPTDADVTEALAILKFNTKVRKTGTTEEVKMINREDERMAQAVLDRAKEFGVKNVAKARRDIPPPEMKAIEDEKNAEAEANKRLIKKSKDMNVTPNYAKELREAMSKPRFSKGGMKKKKYAKGGMPDLTGDGKVTQADVLKGRGVFMKGGMKKKRNANIDYRKSGMFYVGGMSAKTTPINKGKK